jgi:hypothetical protein
LTQSVRLRRLVRPLRRHVGDAWGWPPGRRASSPLLRWLVLLYFANGLLNGLYRPYLVAVPWPVVWWLADAIIYAIVPLAFIWTAIRRGQVKIAQLGLHTTTDFRYGRLFLAILLVLAPMASIIVYAIDVGIAGRVAPGSRALPSGLTWLDLIPDAGPLHVAVIYYLGLSTGLFDEIVYRGALWHIVTQRVAYSWRYVALSAIMFGLIRWEGGPAAMIGTALFGAWMALLFRASGNLWPSIAGHATVDLVWLSMTE